MITIMNRGSSPEARAIENVRTKCIILYLVKHSTLGAKNMNKFCLKIVQKVLKWPLQHANFQNFSGVACPLESFLLLKLLKINSAGKKCA